MPKSLAAMPPLRKVQSRNAISKILTPTPACVDAGRVPRAAPSNRSEIEVLPILFPRMFEAQQLLMLGSQPRM
tara:strand:- start:167 stop:385 length:219 start_codon:yes stop_codon:yes gene_type:complete